MKNNNFILVFSLLFLTLISCTKEIKYKGEDKDPVLVLNGIVENDSIFKIYLERSVFFLSSEESDEKYIKSGALLTLTDLTNNEVYTMTNSTSDNLYEFPINVKPNTKYKIEITHPDYETISSEITTVSKIKLIDVDTSSYYDNEGYLLKKAKLKWQDPLGKNYYYLHVSEYDPLYDYKYEVWYSSKDPVFGGEGNEPTSAFEDIMINASFNDLLFDGQLKELEIEFGTYFADSIQHNPIYTYELITVSKEVYLYIESVKKHSNSQGFMTEPIKVFSNIQNGFGIFGSQNISKITK
jgi:hypothetical protein